MCVLVDARIRHQLAWALHLCSSFRRTSPFTQPGKPFTPRFLQRQRSAQNLLLFLFLFLKNESESGWLPTKQSSSPYNAAKFPLCFRFSSLQTHSEALRSRGEDEISISQQFPSTHSSPVSPKKASLSFTRKRRSGRERANKKKKKEKIHSSPPTLASVVVGR